MRIPVWYLSVVRYQDFNCLSVRSSTPELISLVILPVLPLKLASYLTDVDKQIREERKEKIFAMFMACHTQQEIADAVNVSRTTIEETVTEFPNLEKASKNLASFSDPDFETPIYNVWVFAKKTNEVSHFGNSEVTINL